MHDTGAFDTSFKVNVHNIATTVAVAQDGSSDVLVSAGSPVTLYRFNRSGALLSAPAFITPTLVTSHPGFVPSIGPIVPLQDGTGDFYIGGSFTSYNGVAVNHFARVHADGSLASVVSAP